MAKASDLKQGCAFFLGMLLVMVTGVVMFVFVYLPLTLVVGILKLFGRGRINRPRPRSRRD